MCKIFFYFVFIFCLNNVAICQKGNTNYDSLIFSIYVSDSCLKLSEPLMLHMIIKNKSNTDFLFRSKNVFFNCDIIDLKGDTLIPNYNIGHARDWAEKNYYLLKPHTIDTITFLIQKNLYCNLQKGEYYNMILTYENIQKRYRGTKGEFKVKKLFRGRVSLNRVRIITCLQ